MPVVPISVRPAARVLIMQEACSSFPRSTPENGVSRAVPVLAAALVPVVADFSLRLLQDYLTRAQTEQTATYRASGSGVIPAGPTPQACLIVIRGTMGPPAAGLPAESGGLNLERLRTLGLAAYPDFYMEASIRPDPASNVAAAQAQPNRRAADTQVHLLLRPEMIQFARTAAVRAGDGTKAVGMVVMVRTEPLAAGTKEEQVRDGALLVIPFDFGRMATGTWMRAPNGNEDDTHPFADQQRSLRFPALHGTANIDAFVTETGEPSRILELLSATLTAKGGTIEKAITDALEKALAKATRN